MKRPFLASLAALAASFYAPAPAQAQNAEESARLEERGDDIIAAMRGDASYDSVFADAFVNAVPQDRFLAIKQQLETQFGPLVGIEMLDPVSANGATIAIRFERGLANGSFNLETAEPYEINGFVLNDVRPIGDNTGQLLSAIQALPGETAVLVAPLGGGEPMMSHNADQQFAIGSTFKLYVLSALAHSIAQGERNWSDVVRLSQRSYPSGQLQNWPEGAPVTLHTLATLMISNSDNTATDQLITELGRDAVEAEVIAAGHSAPEGMFPFLTTRELFLLKSDGIENLGKYAAAGTAERLALLQELAQLDRGSEDIQAAFAGGPVAIDVEWLASVSDIASLFSRITQLEDQTALDILAVNPSMSGAMRDSWDYVGYKGGSEPGVLNLSWLLRDAAGTWQVVSMSWNDSEAPVDQSAFELLAMRAIALAAGN
ncbi:serine hydrolase [Aurantiacibacter rhizosphaerae]|uniref:Serine hydrolase n=1 Tax=Aurantiacibacter rhizosphaerae TaxID=2691582 RepID=A0A844XE10_9SPHN|nr:serine hydrolase [Aurantiacibacter rhizosphaerae]MWV27993.1 serine hydrolase [Aurantiacibacter rhizosphaerae]